MSAVGMFVYRLNIRSTNADACLLVKVPRGPESTRYRTRPEASTVWLLSGPPLTSERGQRNACPFSTTSGPPALTDEQTSAAEAVIPSRDKIQRRFQKYFFIGSFLL